jgi:hypothetical protein
MSIWCARFLDMEETAMAQPTTRKGRAARMARARCLRDARAGKVRPKDSEIEREVHRGQAADIEPDASNARDLAQDA